MNSIGYVNEEPLHSVLKKWYAGAEGRVAVLINGFVVDVYSNNAIIEIQTGNFSSIKTKITKLVSDNNLKLVFPITAEKWLLKYPEGKSGKVNTRKSPKKGHKEEIFSELVSFPELI
jgi:hypothetical protein